MKFEIEYSKVFLKKYKKLVTSNPELKNRINKSINLFSKDPTHNSLHSHKVSSLGKGAFTFSATRDLRIAYFWKDKIAIFLI